MALPLAAAALGMSAGHTAHAAPPPPCTTDNLLAGKTPSQQRDVTGDPALVTNGTVVLDGASWDAPAGIKLGSTAGSLTYDLGKPTRLSAFLLQADANDSYKVLGSQTGEPGSFTLIAQAGNVVDQQGHGLRTRTMKIEPVTVRYLRIGEADGDNAFSITEFAAYCAAPTPFPPALKTTEAPMAVAAKHKSGEPPAITPPPPKTVRRVRRRDGAAAAPGRVRLPAQQQARGGRRPARTASACSRSCCCCSSAAGARRSSTRSSGSSCCSSSSARRRSRLACCSARSWVACASAALLLPRYVSPERHPLRVYAVLELAIGVIGTADLFHAARAGGSTRASSVGVPGLCCAASFAAICLLPPTMLMGATLPAIARCVERRRAACPGSASSTAATSSARCSAASLAGFYLLRDYDVTFATFVAVALNVGRRGCRVPPPGARRRQPMRRGLRAREVGLSSRSSQGAPSAVYAPSRSPGSPRSAPKSSGRACCRSARRNGIRVLAHPRGVPDRARRGQRDRLGARAASGVRGTRSASCQSLLVARARLGR